MAIDKQFVPKRASLFDGTRIVDAGCGKHFCIFLSVDGEAFVCGQVNAQQHVSQERIGQQHHILTSLYLSR